MCFYFYYTAHVLYFVVPVIIFMAIFKYYVSHKSALKNFTMLLTYKLMAITITIIKKVVVFSIFCLDINSEILFFFVTTVFATNTFEHINS